MADEKNNPDSSQDKLATLEEELKTSKPAAKNKNKPSSTSRPPTRPVRQAEKPRTPLMLWFVSLLSLTLTFAAIGAGYYFWLQWQNQQTQRTQLLDAQTQVNLRQGELERRVDATLAEQTSNMKDALSAAQAQIADLEHLVNIQAAKLNEVSGRRPSDWLIAEADYLVRMAGRKVWLEGDIRTALLMLQSADSRLQDTADPSLIPIRRLIAEDIQRLNQVNPVSVTSVALAVSGLTKLVDALPIALPNLPSTEAGATISEDAGDWRANLLRQWNFFVKNLINYQPRTAPIKPLLSEDQQWFIRQQLKLALQQAQLAVQQQENALYYQSLQRGLALIINHYDTEHTLVVQFTNSLQNLLDTNVEKSYPDAFASSQPLQDLLETRVSNAFSNKGQAL
ncbi:uroporphyrinogen-III C-methyltransferase [Aestuariibacter sp. AA17]|uniref:Uroporphyrinogen-III C-methyltransferase n=1 Tax=Fluctibacter corallii TaxID=2984329 RepID=A0ABT3ABX7_9ALTE|nr:uroporphyrinogen-III C-methyltransferase [Aestuariibacter sp. AA17]MCV2886181.1 uroporphyrinogen-III C-methyltransferase [Aestuariibacter sp. AA17]